MTGSEGIQKVFWKSYVRSINPIQDGFFRGCSGMGGWGGGGGLGGAKKAPHPKNFYTKPTMMKLKTYTLTREGPKNT